MNKFKVLLEQINEIVADLATVEKVRDQLASGDFADVRVTLTVKDSNGAERCLDAPLDALTAGTQEALCYTASGWADKRLLAGMEELAKCVGAMFEWYGAGKQPAQAPFPPVEDQPGAAHSIPPDWAQDAS